jgi:hypothetical protein
MNHQRQAITAHNFSAAFEQMCSMVAIGNTKGVDETLTELVLHCMFFLNEETFTSPSDFSQVTDGLFGITIPEHEIEFALEQLLASEQIRKSSQDHFVLPNVTKTSIQKRVDAAYALEEEVKTTWQEELLNDYPNLDADLAWRALRYYLAKAFQRHGIQAAALLDPTIENGPEYSENLNVILGEAVQKTFQPEQYQAAKLAMSDFMAMAGTYINRATYISQLADGAFNYFALTISPEIAERFTENLNDLVLFFDTNFLFGILDLTVNPQVAVSNELMNAIEKHNLPFTLKMHEVTSRELQASINNYATDLASRHWALPISRAASQSRNLSGVELRYHQRFAETGIDVDSFFRPFHHVDVLLEEKEISTVATEDDRAEERATLIADYQIFIKGRGKEKSYKLIDHDMTVLDVVRRLRTTSGSSLDAGALLVTCDYSLYQFDWETSRKAGHPACTVLPNIFWQILRPFIPQDTEFDRSFAETFAIPEFRIIGSRSSEATSKMLNLLAAYKDISEDVAMRLLSNDLLIERLRTAENTDVFQQYIDSAIVDDNNALAEENAAIAKRLDDEVQRSKQAKKQLQEESQKSSVLESNLSKQATELEKEKIARIKAEKKAIDAEKEKEAAIQNAQREKERTALYLGIGKSIILGLTLIVFFESVVLRVPWDWLLNHENSLGLQFSIDLLLVLLSFLLFVPRWRNKILWGGLVPIIFLAIQLLGAMPTK